MKLTKNLKLKKPDYEDIADIAQLNENMDIIDTAIHGQIKKEDLDLALKTKADKTHEHENYLKKTSSTQSTQDLESAIAGKANASHSHSGYVTSTSTIRSGNDLYSRTQIDTMIRQLQAAGITEQQIQQMITAQIILQKLKTVDGVGSGLDADTLDGLDSSAFLRTTGKAADADKLDGRDSSFFATSSRVEELFQLSADAKQAHIGGINQIINYNSGLTTNNSWQDILWWWQNKACIDYAINRLQIRKIIATISKGSDGFAYQTTPFSKVLFMAYYGPGPGTGWTSTLSAANVWGLSLSIGMIGKNYGQSASLIQIDGGRMKFTNLSHDQVTLEFYLIGF